MVEQTRGLEPLMKISRTEMSQRLTHYTNWSNSLEKEIFKIIIFLHKFHHKFNKDHVFWLKNVEEK